jgi:hypothetical protein
MKSNARTTKDTRAHKGDIPGALASICKLTTGSLGIKFEYRRRLVMSLRKARFLTLALLLVPLASPKDKKKTILPDYVLKARTVLVVVDPDAGIALQNPNANRLAQEDVEKALMNWGRFTLAMEPRTADLVISIRKGSGRVVSPTVTSPGNNRPVIMQPTDDGIRIGGQRGTPPPVTNSGMGGPQDGRPHPGTEIGPSGDLFAVYRGGVDYPLDSPPEWRYIAKDSLSSPGVPAVGEFRKAIEEAEKQRQAQQKKP